MQLRHPKKNYKQPPRVLRSEILNSRQPRKKSIDEKNVVIHNFRKSFEQQHSDSPLKTHHDLKNLTPLQRHKLRSIQELCHVHGCLKLS
ncbi:hypothetical protein CEXT_142761 [Caerostris extrusa]|uniref:Uncharacterized protein n=1 Tax=Caerostris extrusa TaxID=172846 RepID=A0AAV4UJD7_CAEEX|nr:hypothetical protein CEXT_142761 [Caerostris extrusa]